MIPRHPSEKWRNPNPTWATHALWLIPLLAVIFFYLVLKMFTMHAYAGDEHIYLYQAKLVAEGAVPYADFAMAHPPLQTLFTAFVFELFGYHFALGRALPVAWCLLGALGLTVLVRREHGNLAAVAAAALTLLAYEPLRASSHYTGVNMTIALLVFAVLAYRRNAIRTAALISVLAVFTRLYAAPGVLVLTLYAVVVRPRQGLQLVAWGAGLGIAALLAVGLWTGFDNMFHNLLLYHAQKTPMTEAALSGMQHRILFHNALEITLFVLALAAMTATLMGAFFRSDPERHPHLLARLQSAFVQSGLGLVVLSSCIAIVFLAVLTSMDRVWMYYFVPSFPFAAVAGGWLISRWGRAGLRLVRARGNLRRADLSPPAFAAGITLLALLAVSVLASPRLEANLTYYKKAMTKPPGERIHRYRWQPGWLPAAVNEAVKAALWHDQRTIGTTYNRFNYLLWHESRILDIADEVVRVIDNEVSDRGAIFGDSGTVPLFALLSGRPIAANEVDTNIQRYRSGNADPKQLIEKIDRPHTEMIILRDRFGVAGVREVRRLIQQKYRLLKKLRTFNGKRFSLYKRRGMT